MKTTVLQRPQQPDKTARTRPKVLLISDCPKLSEALVQILPTQCELIVRPNLQDARSIIQDNPHVPIIADFSQKLRQSEGLSLLLHGHASNNTVFISDESDEENLRFMFEHPGVLNLMPKSFPDFTAQLKIVLLKKFGQRSIWGTQYYLSKKAAVEKLRLYSFSGHGTVLMSLHQKLAQVKAFRSFNDRAQTIAMELMMNAVLDAHPDTALKNQRRAQHNRNDAVKLNKSEQVFIEFGFDEKNFVIGITDNHGTLKARDAMQRIYRCTSLGSREMRMVENRGAGIGFFMMYGWTSHMIFNLEPGVRTEVICVMPLSRREKYALPPHKALNFFVKKTA